MKNSFFSKIIALIFLFGSFCASAQVRIKTNNIRGGKKVVVKKNRPKQPNRTNIRGNVRVKTNRNRVVVNKPNRPNVRIKRPNYKRPGYVWTEGYWEWNAFYSRYTWQQSRWIKIKRNHYWVPGFWQISAGGFFWVQGYWELDY
jgi:hypothetical protein